MVLQLLKTNGDCRLPCWWGITPGVSVWEDTKPFLATFGHVSSKLIRTPNDLFRYAASFPASEAFHLPYGLMASFFVGVDDDTIELIVINRGRPLQEVLEDFGEPIQIWVEPRDAPPNISPEYELSLFYSQLGILAGYHGFGEIRTTTQGEIFAICQDSLNIADAGLILWSPKHKWTFQDVLRPIVTLSERQDRLLEDASNMTLSAFYKNFRKSNSTSCVEIPRQ